MNAKYLAVITLLAASLVGAAQSQAGTVNKGSGGYIGTGGTGGTGGSTAPTMYNAVLRSASTDKVQDGETFTCPSILGVARFSVDTNTTTISKDCGYVNMSAGGYPLEGTVAGAFVTSDGVVATYSATNALFDTITKAALLGDFVAGIGGGIDAKGSGGSFTNSGDAAKQVALVMKGKNNADGISVDYTAINIDNVTTNSIITRK
jgi:hypothetical protein